MSVFVAGAAGVIGKQLVPRLVEAGHEVHGMTRSESKQAIADDLHEALWATFVAQTLTAGPQHCHPRARVPVPGCSEVSQVGLLSCLNVESTTTGGRT